MSMKTIGVAATAVFALSAIEAGAVSVRLTDSFDGIFGNGNDVVVLVNDGDANDGNAAAGIVAFNGAVGSYSVFSATSLTGNLQEAFLSQSVSIGATAGSVSGQLRVESSDNAYVLPTGTNRFIAEFANNGTRFNNGALSTGFFNAGAAALFATDDQIGDALTLSQLNQDGRTSENYVPVSPFGLTILTDILHGSGGRATTYDAGVTVAAVPLPASILLFMSAIAGLGFVSRRKSAA